MTEPHRGPTEVNLGNAIRALAFSADGEHLVSGDKETVRVWRVGDPRSNLISPVATMTAGVVNCLSLSEDYSRIAAGRWLGDGVVVWDANTHERVITLEDNCDINAVDFSPTDPRRLVSASDDFIVSVWDITTGERTLRLPHREDVRAAKYSPHGDRIATATQRSIQVFNSTSGVLLLGINVTVTPWYNTGLLWSKAYIFVVSDDKIKKLQALDGRVVSEWPVLKSNESSYIGLARHGNVIAYSADSVVRFWDESSLTELGHTQRTQNVRSISLSPDNRFIAVGDVAGDITIKSLPHISIPPLTINPLYSTFASRALVRIRLRQWDDAINDTEESIKIHPSILAYIVKSIALVGKGEKHEAYRVCDIAFAYFPSTRIPFLLLTKAIIVFMAGEHDDAISRIDNLISMVPSDPTCRMVQAYMYFFLGNSHMQSSDYELAIHSFQCAWSLMLGLQNTSRLLTAISLVSGWKFGGLDITIQQRLCEALFAAGHVNEGGESLLKMVNNLDKEAYMQETMIKWISDFTCRCLSTPGGVHDTPLKKDFASPILVLLFREWAKTTLTYQSWKDALGVAVNFVIPRFTMYRMVCERLHAIGNVMGAIECLRQMAVELADENDRHDDQAKWVARFKQHCAEELTRLGDATIHTQRHGDAVTLYSAALSLNPASPHTIYMLRSMAYAGMGSWGNALDDTARVLALNTSSLWNYEMVLAMWAKANLTDGSWKDAMIAARSFKAPRFAVFRAICEHLRTVDRIIEVAECLCTMESGLPEVQNEEAEWIASFKSRCRGRLEDLGNAAMKSQQYTKAISHYSAALSLSPPSRQALLIQRSKANSAMAMWKDALDDANEAAALDPSCTWGYEMILVEWAKVSLTDGLWRDALTAAHGFSIPRLSIYQAICTRLELVNQIVEAIDCVHELENELGNEVAMAEAKWLLDFKYRCCWKLAALGDIALNIGRHAEAISQYSTALSLGPASPRALYLKRSKAHAASAMWGSALSDANEAITLDPSLPSGYQMKYVALRGAGHHKEAVGTFETMLLKMSQSLDSETRGFHQQYTETRERIRKTVQDVVRDLPRALINTTSGRLCNKTEQAAAFELLPVFAELVVSTPANHSRIEREVKEYYRYATFSHKWEENEPLFETVLRIVVYDLEESPTHGKLQMFCKIAQKAGFRWAWSDTCCINKADYFVLQEALVAMFKWYQSSALTIIFLRGVRSLSQRGALVRSIWNTRAWTLQEYHASKVVRFYTEDWTPYLNLDISNHKESPQIISEMEEATRVSAQALMALRPGLDDIRAKLCLASRRETTNVEDEAYSLLGLFSVSMPVVYGEGDRSLGRLLAQLLTNSGDTTILAWKGRSGSFNSCLPTNVAVFSEPQTTHIPLAIEQAELDSVTAKLQDSVCATLAPKLYDRLNELPVPMFAGRRMKLPCIAFKLGPLSASLTASGYVFRAQTTVLGIVVIKTAENLSRFSSLYLIHPWIDFLLDRQPVGSITETTYEDGIDNPLPAIPELPSFSDVRDAPTPAFPQTPASRPDHFRQSFQARPPSYSEVASLRPPSSISLMDKKTHALQLVTRLRKPFGALLFTPNGNVAYSRVAAECVVTVQIESITPTILNKLVDSVRVLDVL